MIDWYTWVQVGVGLVVGLLAVGLALAKKQPNDFTVRGLVLIEALLIAQVVLAIVGPRNGNASRGNGLAFWVAGDQLLKGAALNAVQIPELLLPGRIAR